MRERRRKPHAVAAAWGGDGTPSAHADIHALGERMERYVMKHHARQRNGRQGCFGDPARNAQGKVCGAFVRDVRGDVLEKHVDPVVHLLRKYNAYATDKALLEELRRRNGWGIRLVLPDGTVMEAPLDVIDCHGEEVDERWGKQRALRLRYWSVVTSGPRHQFGGHTPPSTGQLALFPMKGDEG